MQHTYNLTDLLNEDAWWSMVILGPQSTGLACHVCIFSQTRGYDPYIIAGEDVAWLSRAQGAVALSIQPQPQIMAGHMDRAPQILAAVRALIVLHREVLLAYWQYALTSDELLRALAADVFGQKYPAPSRRSGSDEET